MNRRQFIQAAGLALAATITQGANTMPPANAKTAYTYRYFIFVEVSRLATANNFAKNWDPDTGGDQTFGGVRLSPTGQEPATHYGAATYATESMKNGITQALGNVSWAQLYTDPPYTWETAMTAAGLKRIYPPDNV